MIHLDFKKEATFSFNGFFNTAIFLPQIFDEDGLEYYYDIFMLEQTFILPPCEKPIKIVFEN